MVFRITILNIPMETSWKFVKYKQQALALGNLNELSTLDEKLPIN